jgi:hypothetical protein
MKKYALVVLVGLIAFAFAEEFPYIPSTDVPARTTHTTSDRVEPEPILINEPVWKELGRMTITERQNSEIDIILERNATDQALQMARRIENLWNSKKYEAALRLFPELANLTNVKEMSIGNKWRTPVPTEDAIQWGDDVRIGNRDSIFINVLDIHRASGNLFAVILFRQGGQYLWATNFSTDGGATWNETYSWWAMYQMRSLDAEVCADHCYIAFGRGSGQDQAFLYRCRASDGQQDTFPDGSNYVTVYTTTLPEFIEEVAFTTNQDFFNSRLYYLLMTDQGYTHFFWDDPDAMSWTGIATNVTDAERGLDACMNEGWSTYPFWISYYDDSNNLNIDAFDASNNYTNLLTSPSGSGSTRYTAISAYHDTMICLHEYQGGTFWVRYFTCYDGGAGTWWYGWLDDTLTRQESPDVTARFDGGEGAVYRYYTPFRELNYCWRDYVGGWTAPNNIAYGKEPYYNKPSIEYLGGGVYGVVFLSWTSPAIQGAYFDRSDWTAVKESKSAAKNPCFISLVPNPSRGHTQLSYAVKTTGSVKVSLFDAAGRLVKDLVNEVKQAGEHSLSIRNHDLAAGIYFIRIETPEQATAKSMTVVR